MINSFDGNFAFLSNFYPSPVVQRGVIYPTVEHAYQASKTLDLAKRALLFTTGMPGQAKRIGQTLELRADWNEVRLGVMRKLLRQKFSEPGMRRRLLDTGSEELVEGNWWGDSYWGVYNGHGLNHLGKLLMEIRYEQSRN